MNYFKGINDLLEYKKSVLQLYSYLDEKLDIIDKEIKFLNNKLDKAKKLNKLSIADVSQVTTISKSRIINPIRKNDTLSNIILDSYYLDLINNKIKDLFVFDK